MRRKGFGRSVGPRQRAHECRSGVGRRHFWHRLVPLAPEHPRAPPHRVDRPARGHLPHAAGAIAEACAHDGALRVGQARDGERAAPVLLQLPPRLARHLRHTLHGRTDVREAAHQLPPAHTPARRQWKYSFLRAPFRARVSSERAGADVPAHESGVTTTYVQYWIQPNHHMSDSVSWGALTVLLTRGSDVAGEYSSGR